MPDGNPDKFFVEVGEDGRILAARLPFGEADGDSTVIIPHVTPILLPKEVSHGHHRD
jgi:hypothetical protein